MADIQKRSEHFKSWHNIVSPAQTWDLSIWIAQNKIWSDKQRQKKWKTGRDLGGNVSFYTGNFKQEHLTNVSRDETGWMPKHSFHNL